MKYYLLLLGFVLLNSCIQDPDPAKKENKAGLRGAFIVNEGNFGKSNASLSFYDFENHSMQNNIFKNANGRDLGDQAQSMTIIDTLGLIVVSGSAKIEVISINSWKSITTINMPSGDSPRNIAYGGNGKIYVTDLWGGKVTIIDLATFARETMVLVGPNPDEILVYKNKAYVANGGFGFNNTVSVLDLEQGKVTKTITVGDYPSYLQLDRYDRISVLCQGRWPAWNDTTDKGTDGGIYNIQPHSDEVEDSLRISGNVFEYGNDGYNSAYFIKGRMVGNIAVYAVNKNEMLSDTLFSGYYYAVEADPVTGSVFALDAKDFAQNGSLKIFDDSGTLLETHETGIIPGAVTFIYKDE